MLNPKDKVQQHFDQLAVQYDSIKQTNWFYFSEVVRSIKKEVPEQTTILEVGCGTGNLLNELKPTNGLGIDISPRMIEVAEKKNKNKDLSFKALELNKLGPAQPYKYIIAADVIEHVHDLDSFFKELHRISTKDTIILISYANPWWEPLLMLLEKLKLKMPEGPHHRPSHRKLNKIIRQNGFKIVKHTYQTITPIHVPGLTKLINFVFEKIPFLNRLCLLELLVLRKV